MSNSIIFYKKNNNSKLFSYFNDLSENRIKNMQNYIPIYKRFFSLNQNNFNAINLNHKHNIHTIEKIIDINHYSIFTTCEKTKNKKASFFKFSPLLDTTKYMAGKYKDISLNIITNLPKVEESSSIIKKINCFDNSAYTDSFFSFLSSKLLNQHKFIHGIDFYGSFLGIKHRLTVGITDDLEYLYDYDFFHKNKNILFETDKINEGLLEDDTRKNRTTIEINKEDEELKVDTLNNDAFSGLFMELTKENLKKFNNTHLNDIDISDCNANYRNNIKNSKCDVGDNKTNTECSSRISDTSNEDDISENDLSIEDSNDSEEIVNNESNESSDDFSELSDSNNGDNIYASIFNFPCQIICLENLIDTLDSLMEESILTNKEWSSCLFQIIMTLITYQRVFDFTHNDLHTNNIMFVETDKKFINYHYNNIYYRVPTYGKIYKIIDFGRSIYKFDGKQIISDSFYLNGDAAGQYNFSSCMNNRKKELLPNKSFDLSRLGCSLFDHFFNDINDEPNTDIEKIVVDWVTDDNGKNILYKSNGEERYPDFKLYKMISRKITKHLPENQLKKEMFKKYISSKKKIGKKAKIVDIDKLPVYI